MPRSSSASTENFVLHDGHWITMCRKMRIKHRRIIQRNQIQLDQILEIERCDCRDRHRTATSLSYLPHLAAPKQGKSWRDENRDLCRTAPICGIGDGRVRARLLARGHHAARTD